MASVYWVKHPEHTDMFSQGYIGVTKRDAQSRYRGHKQAMKQGAKAALYSAMRAYGDSLEVRTLVICDEDYAYSLEHQLRPTERIGWNLAAGGVKSGNYGGYSLSDETRAKMSANRTGNSRTPEWNAKIAAARRGVVRGPLPGDSVEKRERTRFIRTFSAGWEIWQKADEFHARYCTGMTLWYAAKATQIEYKLLRPIFSAFSRGWIPSEDHDWLKLKEAEFVP